MRTQYDADDVERVISALVEKIARAFKPDQPLGIIGVLTHGEVLAERLSSMLQSRGFGQIQACWNRSCCTGQSSGDQRGDRSADGCRV
ncbi:MAG: hypothetical protein QM767_28000 [Anaeromyxobacter sp.]